MKKTGSKEDYTLRPEYDFSKLKRVGRGVYAERLKRESNIVVLDPDVAKGFPNAKAVNDALRLLLKVAKLQVKRAA